MPLKVLASVDLISGPHCKVILRWGKLQIYIRFLIVINHATGSGKRVPYSLKHPCAPREKNRNFRQLLSGTSDDLRTLSSK